MKPTILAALGVGAAFGFAVGYALAADLIPVDRLRTSATPLPGEAASTSSTASPTPPQPGAKALPVV